MDLYEYQGKELFKRFGIPVSDGRLATTPEEARAAAEELGGQVVVKAQVLTGGRGKAGGIKLADDSADAEQKAEEILGLDINGHVVRKLWIERASEIAKEYYLSATFDRGAKKTLFMVTTEGGIEIEEVAARSPDADIFGDHLKQRQAVRVFESTVNLRRHLNYANHAVVGDRPGECFS